MNAPEVSEDGTRGEVVVIGSVVWLGKKDGILKHDGLTANWRTPTLYTVCKTMMQFQAGGGAGTFEMRRYKGN